MSYLSSPIGELKSHYDVVVIGSGYGGGVVACRVAQAHLARQNAGGAPVSVCVLERGEEWRTGDFPVSPMESLGQLQVDHPLMHAGPSTGLFDLRVWPEMAVLVGCGLGGTSLINANVMIPPRRELFDEWPGGGDWWRKELGLNKDAARTRFYDVAGSALGATRCPDDLVIQKRTSLHWAGMQCSIPNDDRSSPPLAVSFGHGPNEFKVPRRRCQLCGDCVTGCNHDAKNTVDRNYLAGARHAGAEIYCGLSVDSVESIGDNGAGGWVVHTRVLDSSGRRFPALTLPIRATTVFIAAGAIGSTEILLRSRELHGLALSPQLGHKFSGNGDVIAFSYNGSSVANSFGCGVNLPQTPSVGPCITGMLDHTRRDGQDERITIQDAAIPGALAPLIRFGGWFIARRTLSRTGPGAGGFSSEFHTIFRGITIGAVARTQTFLVMSRDNAEGVLQLSQRMRATLKWPGITRDTLFGDVNRRLAELTRKLEGRFVLNPMWTGRRPRLVSVHPLGGCAMGEDGEQGVVDTEGRVFKGASANVHGGLYVCDGAIVPTAIGRNPALTIAALAERIACEFLGRPADPWPRRPEVSQRLSRSCSGEPEIRYTERLTGQIHFASHPGVTPGQYDLELVLHISADSVETLLTDRRHETRIVGVARTTSKGGVLQEWMISDGRMNVLVSDPRTPDTKLLVYRLQLRGTNGILYLRGHKTVNLATCRKGMWHAVTSFSFVIHNNQQLHERGPADERDFLADQRETQFAVDCTWTEEHEKALKNGSSAGIGYGLVHGRLADVLRLVASFEIRRERSRARRIWFLARYSSFFVGQALQAKYPWLQGTQRIDPLNRPQLDYPRATGRHVVVDTKVPPRFLLTRYDAAPQSTGPSCEHRHVVLAPGIGMSSEAFRLGKPSLVEYLTKRNFTVWLLDYRGSDLLDTSLTQFDLDDLVTDFKDAIDVVSEEAGERVHLVSHCVASLVTTMHLLKHGAEANGPLKSVVLSSSHAFINHPRYNHVMAWLRVPRVLRLLGFEPVFSTDIDPRSSWRVHLLDKLLKLQPTNEHCSSAVCRRTRFMYGEVVHHAQIDRHTHDMMYDMFDRTNLEAFNHLTRMTRAGRIVDRHGRNAYLTEKNAQKIEIPVTFLWGEKNGLFRPDASARTVTWFQKNNGQPSLFTPHPVPGYGHLDLFIGKKASEEVFPRIVHALRPCSVSRQSLPPSGR